MQDFRIGFSRHGAVVHTGAARLGMTLSGYGFGSALEPVKSVVPRASGSRVRYAHGALTEWYANGPLGLEQGFDLAARPNSAAGPLTLSLALSGDLAPRLRDNSVLLEGRGVALRYGSLIATDARGHVLPSWLQLVNGQVLIRVEDRGATYPLRIDPMVQQGAKLTGTGAVGTGRFGYAVALSADGNTALVGANYENIGAGGAWVFVRSGGAWTQQGGKLVGTGHAGVGEFAHVGEGEFGVSVALSADGDTALIGAPADDERTGAAWAFTRTGSTWSQQGPKLIGTGETGEGRFGSSVALSADGNTALIGAPADDERTGAAWAFTRTGSTWSQQGPKLTGTGETGEGRFGSSVALSTDGNTALIGGWADDSSTGAAWAFTRSGSTWTQQGAKLTGAGAVGSPWFGYTVALSGDGNTALIGGWLDDSWKGGVWVFTRSGSTWTQQGGKLTASDEDGNGMFGTNVTLSADGNTALIGGWNDDSVASGDRDYSGKGAAWVFTRSGSTWTQQGPKLTASDETGNGKFGTIVALSAKGDTALIGGWNDDHSEGAAWVFTRSGSTWTQQGGKLTADDETGEGRFGVAVALSADGDTALVGGLADNSTRGAAWLFTRSGSTWAQQGGKITGVDQAGEGEFGTNVALSADGATALVGAWRDNSGTGASWVFVNPPLATTGATTGVGETGATLNGSLAAGRSSTAHFEYGTTAAYGASTAAQGIGVSSSPSSLAAAIGGLAPGTTYHFRLVAENSGGVDYGDDRTFTTEAPTTPPPPCCDPDPGRPPSALLVQNVRQSTLRWRVGNRLATVSRAEAPIGTIFSFSLNERATVTFSFTRRISRRKSTVPAGTVTSPATVVPTKWLSRDVSRPKRRSSRGATRSWLPPPTQPECTRRRSP